MRTHAHEQRMGLWKDRTVQSILPEINNVVIKLLTDSILSSNTTSYEEWYTNEEMYELINNIAYTHIIIYVHAFLCFLLCLTRLLW